MANTQDLSSSLQRDFMLGVHHLATDTIKAALYKTIGSLGANTQYYSSTSEVTGTNYVPGGVIVATATPPMYAGRYTYWTPSANIIYRNVSLLTPFNAVLLYNASKSNRAIGVWVFDQATVNLSDFILYMPPNTTLEALVRFKRVD